MKTKMALYPELKFVEVRLANFVNIWKAVTYDDIGRKLNTGHSLCMWGSDYLRCWPSRGRHM